MQPVLVIIGPSGGGKSSAVRLLAAQGVLRVHPTWTTRPRRADERTGSLEHRFVTDARFDELERRRFFLDTVTLFGLAHRYGLPPVVRSNDGAVDTVMLRAPLVERFRAVVPDIVVVQVEDRPDRLRARLEARGTDDLEARLADNELELAAGRRIADRVVVNGGSLAELAEAVAA
jgi:guanylate kinase